MHYLAMTEVSAYSNVYTFNCVDFLTSKHIGSTVMLGYVNMDL